MQTHRLKRSFTAGEISPWLFGQVENERYRNGCKALLNAYAKPQGPAWRRSGTRFIDDIQARMEQPIEGQPKPRLVPFIVDETTAYELCFYPHVSGNVRISFMTGVGLVIDDTAIRVLPDASVRTTPKGELRVSPGFGSGTEPFIYEISGTFSIADFQYAQSKDILFIVQSGRRPLELRRVQPDVWTLNESVFIDEPSDWSGVSGYPTLVTFYEQRSVYSSTKSRPQATWLSKSGRLNDFGEGSPIVESDSFTFTLDSGRQNAIRWLLSTRKLLIGTVGDEWSSGGAGNTPTSFETHRATVQTNQGGASLAPIKVGSAAIFLERQRRTVNQFTYSLNDDSYTITDLSILAPHLTLNNYIVDWDYQSEPNGIIWCVRDDGVMIGLTYQQEHNIVGWHRHTTPDGSFVSVSSIPGDREDEVWVVVERTIDGVDKWYVEKMAREFTSEDTRDAYFLDCHAIYEGDPVTTISNLGFLEGQEVGVMGDGAVMAPKTVVSGEIELEAEKSKVVVGKNFISQVEPTLNEIALSDGTNRSRRQRISKMDVELYNSVGLYYGSGPDDMAELPFRTPLDATGSPVPLFSGSVPIPFPEGWDRQPRIILEQRQPLPMCVIGIVDTIKVNDSR